MKLQLPANLEKFDFYYNQLRKYEGIVEIKKVMKKRTFSQNRYVHVIIALCACEEGYPLGIMKQKLKKECHFMNFELQGEIYLRSSADLDTKEMTDWIEWIRNRAAKDAGYYIPSPDEFMRNWETYEMTIEQNKQYL